MGRLCSAVGPASGGVGCLAASLLDAVTPTPTPGHDNPGRLQTLPCGPGGRMALSGHHCPQRGVGGGVWSPLVRWSCRFPLRVQGRRRTAPSHLCVLRSWCGLSSQPGSGYFFIFKLNWCRHPLVRVREVHGYFLRPSTRPRSSALTSSRGPGPLPCGLAGALFFSGGCKHSRGGQVM